MLNLWLEKVVSMLMLHFDSEFFETVQHIYWPMHIISLDLVETAQSPLKKCGKFFSINARKNLKTSDIFSQLNLLICKSLLLQHLNLMTSHFLGFNSQSFPQVIHVKKHAYCIDIIIFLGFSTFPQFPFPQ